MTHRSEHTDSFDDDFFDQFSDEKRDEIKNIWESSPQARPDTPDVSTREIDDALKKVNRRLDSGQQETTQKKLQKNRRKWFWPMAAAIIILITASAWLFTPRTVTVPNGEVAHVTLPDGSTVTLNSGSRLHYSELYSYTNRELNLNGEAFFSVQHGDHPFIIHANHSNVKVTGTKFNVRSWAEDPNAPTEVSVVEGTVQFYRDESQKIIRILPGQMSQFSAGMQEPAAPDSVDLGRVLGWRSNKLIFNNRSLIIIFNELERRFDTDIKIKDPAISKEKLSAYYPDPSGAESILKDICRVKGLKYARTNNGFRVYRKK